MGKALRTSDQSTPVNRAMMTPAVRARRVDLRTIVKKEPVMSHQQVRVMNTQMTSREIDD
jgi:hypothetical protein